MDKKHIIGSILLALPFLGVEMSPLGGTWTASIIIWCIFVILLAIYNREWIKRKFKLRSDKANYPLKVTMLYSKIGGTFSSSIFTLLVTVKFEPLEPIQLGKLDLVYKFSPESRYITYSPSGGLPTKLIERVETHEVGYEISGFSGDFLLKIGFLEQSNRPESEWPQAYLHVLAGNLDFITTEVPTPTPERLLTSGKEGSQN